MRCASVTQRMKLTFPCYERRADRSPHSRDIFQLVNSLNKERCHALLISLFVPTPKKYVDAHRDTLHRKEKMALAVK